MGIHRHRSALPRALLTTALVSATVLAVSVGGQPTGLRPADVVPVAVQEPDDEEPGPGGPDGADGAVLPPCEPGTGSPRVPAADAQERDDDEGDEEDDEVSAPEGEETSAQDCVPPTTQAVPVPMPPSAPPLPTVPPTTGTLPGPRATPPVPPAIPVPEIPTPATPSPPFGTVPEAAPVPALPSLPPPGPTGLPDGAPGRLPGEVPGGVPGQVPGAVPGAVPGQLPGGIPGAVPGQVPGAVPGQLPGGIPGAVPGQVPGVPAGPGAPQVPVGQQEYFVGDFENGFGDWNSCQSAAVNGDCAGVNEHHGMQIVERGGPDGGAFARFVVKDGDTVDFGGERAELRDDNAGATVNEGYERWYEWSMRVGDDFPEPSGDWFIVMQWHGGDGPPPLAVDLSRGSVDLDGDGAGEGRETIGAIRRGEWVDYVLHVKFSTDPSEGFVEAWENGVQTVPRTNRATMSSDTNYLKQGIYRDEASDGTAQVDFSDLRVTGPPDQGEVQPKLRKTVLDLGALAPGIVDALGLGSDAAEDDSTGTR